MLNICTKNIMPVSVRTHILQLLDMCLFDLKFGLHLSEILPLYLNLFKVYKNSLRLLKDLGELWHNEFTHD